MCFVRGAPYPTDHETNIPGDMIPVLGGGVPGCHGPCAPECPIELAHGPLFRYITMNIAVERGICNGTRGNLRTIVLDDREDPETVRPLECLNTHVALTVPDRGKRGCRVAAVPALVRRGVDSLQKRRRRRGDDHTGR